MFDDLFICGCEDVTDLAPAVKRKIDEFVEKRSHIYTGNAEGTELLVQEYLYKKGYENVTIVTTQDDHFVCEGKWEVLHRGHSVCPDKLPKWMERSMKNLKREDRLRWRYDWKDFFHRQKEKHYEYMIEECSCSYGLAVWDRKSTDIFLNILDMVFLFSRAWVLLAGENELREINTFEDAKKLLPEQKDDSVGRRKKIPLRMYERIVRDCVPSEDMRKAMMEQMVSKKDLVPLILNAPVWTGIKERCLSALAATDDILRDLVELSKWWQDMNGADIETCDARHLYSWIKEESAGEHLEIIREAHRELLEMKPGEILYLKEAWYDEEVLDEHMKENGAAAFTSFDAARDHIRRMMGEEEWNEDTCCWNVLEKWRPGMDGCMDNIYTYYLIWENVVYIDSDKCKARIFRRGLAGGLDGISEVASAVRPPFDVGDAVLIDQRPFAPVRYGVMTFKGKFIDDNYVLYKDVRNGWQVRNLGNIMLADGVMCSSYYRLEKTEWWALPKDEHVLRKVQEYIVSHEKRGEKRYGKRRRRRGERIDGLFSGDGALKGRVTDEVLEAAVEKLAVQKPNV